jgi:hypothetical protein
MIIGTALSTIRGSSDAHPGEVTDPGEVKEGSGAMLKHDVGNFHDGVGGPVGEI